ncbi:Fic family protein [Candidatus Saccharibacteria bacterium]|nr:Fic family protein [Candidatus Saccharibacteria bacterium]
MAGTGTEPDESLTRTFATTHGVLTYAQLADQIAPHLLSLLSDIADGKFLARDFDENLIREFHRRIIGEILPDIAGKWRGVTVQVGVHVAPPPSEIPLKMREYVANLRERFSHADTTDLQVELLAYAEGEFLTIHPFADFNGRTIRALLTELLMRLDLPPVEVAVQRNTPMFKRYQNALAEYDNDRLQPLIDFWVERFSDE